MKLFAIAILACSREDPDKVCVFQNYAWTAKTEEGFDELADEAREHFEAAHGEWEAVDVSVLHVEGVTRVLN